MNIILLLHYHSHSIYDTQNIQLSKNAESPMTSDIKT